MQTFSRRFRRDGYDFARQHVPSIQAHIHLHDHDTCFPVSGHDRTLNGRCTTPARQKRGMQIEAAQPWGIKDRFWQQKPVGHDNRDIQIKCCEGCLFVCPLQAFRRPYLDPQFIAQAVHRGSLQLHPPPRLAGWLRIDGNHMMAGIHQRFEDGDGKIRRAHKGQAERF